MRKLFAIEHMRTMLMMAFVYIPLIVGVMWLGLALVVGGGDEPVDPSFHLYLGIAMVAALLITMAVLLWFMFAVLRPQRYIQDMDRLAAGEHWVHWAYDEAQWKAANTVESARVRRGFGAAQYGLVLGAVVLLIGLLVGGEDGSTFVFVGGVLIVTTCGAMVLMWLSGSATFARDARTGQVSISGLGVLRRPGGYSAFAAIGPLKSVGFVAGPSPRVVFTVVQNGRYGAVSDYQTADLLVPAGREDEARALVERFNTEVLKAS
ncbi:hypothetical protein ABZS66_10600 [Dactylosporangium sp. NPDC005572]|uniref:hypothetical protein n=1 Tax=Dactylosporangium sp. NPDC005572 TaxID=3156889 RepID=UPI0033AF9E49